MHTRSFIVGILLTCIFASCSTPSASVRAVPTVHNSVAFDFRMKGCWGIGTGCFGVSRLSVQEVSTARTLWEVQFPGIQAGSVSYGRMPSSDQLKRSKYSNPGMWPSRDNPGFHKAAPLPLSTDLVATVSFHYDSPWPSGSVGADFFRIERDGSIQHLKNRSLSELPQR